MDDALIVRGFEGLNDLPGNRERVVNGNRAVKKTFFERLSFHELEHERADAVGFFEAVDGGDVWMIERCEHLRLTLKAREAIGVGRQGGWKDRQRDIALQSGVARPIDLAHPTCAEGAGDLVWTNARPRGKGHGGPDYSWACVAASASRSSDRTLPRCSRKE